ncbi:cytochrome c biogenesis protein CcdA [Pantoea ananatis]
MLFSASLQQYFATATAGVGNAGNNFLNRLNPTGIRGQFITGLVLGVIWSPCVGPTLGGAIVMASQGTQLLQVMLLMGLFGAGAALPVGLLSFLSMAAILRFRGKNATGRQSRKDNTRRFNDPYSNIDTDRR